MLEKGTTMREITVTVESSCSCNKTIQDTENSPSKYEDPNLFEQVLMSN